MDGKSGGDTSFAPLAPASGDMDGRGFWEHATPDKRGIWTTNRQLAPGLADYTERIGATFGRVRVIKLNPSDQAAALRPLHRDDNNRPNPGGAGWVIRSWLELDNAPGEPVFLLREEKTIPQPRPGSRCPP